MTDKDTTDKINFDWKRILFILLGLGFFFFIYFSPPWKDAVDPLGKAFSLSKEGKASIALFMLAGTWWVFEVIPIGLTSIAIGVFQALFAIRSAKDAFRDFMDPSVMFIFGSIVVGLAFPKTGLTRRIAYSAGAGSVISMLGSARAPAAAGMFKEFTGGEIGFFELAKYMFPVGMIMVLLIWAFLMIFLKPEKKTIAGLKEQVKRLSSELGPMRREEKFVILCVIGVVITMSLQSFVPAFKALDRSAIMLVSTLLFFISGVLTINELEDIPWNIILLFSGAMSIGFCLWQTGGAQWIAVKWLALFQEAHWAVFVLSIAFFVLLMTNFIMNVAAIAISLPVALVIARYLGGAPDVVMFASLVP